MKWDWERAKKEVLGDKLRWMEYGLWVLSVIIYGLGMLYNTYTYIFGIYGAIMCPVTNVLVQKHTDYLSLLQFVALLYGMVAFFARIIWVLVLYVKTYKYECAVGQSREEYLGMTKQK